MKTQMGKNEIYQRRGAYRFAGLLVFLALLLVMAIPVCAAEKTPDERVVRVSAGINKALYLNEEGQPEGYCSEYLNQLAKINHWQVEYVEASWTDSVQNLADGKIDLLFPTQMTEERQKTMGFSNAIGGYQPIGLFAESASDYCYDDYEKFDGAKIAVSAGTSNEAALKQYATENNFTYTPVYLNTTQEKLDALETGEVDMIVFSTLNDVEEGKVVAMLDYLPFYYCTRINDAALMKELDYGMNQMLLRNPTLVQEVFYDFMNRNISFAYTVEEKKAIDEKGTVTVGIYMDTPPLFDVNKDGSFQGVYVDLIQRVEELSGMDIEIRPLDRKEYAFDYLERGDIDFVLGSSDQALKYIEKAGYVQSEGIMDYYSIAISKPDYAPEKEKAMVFALTTGRKYWSDKIMSECPKASIQYYDTSKECLEAVQSGKVDLTLLNTWEYNYQSKNERFRNLIEWENSRTLSETVFISKETENALIRSVLDKSIEQIANAEKEAIITANLNGAYRDYNLKDRIYSMKESLVIFGSLFLILIISFAVYFVMRRTNIKKLKEKNEQLFSANEAKNRFLSRMSHELRTPLNAISGYTTVVEQNLEESDIDLDKTRFTLASIHRAVKYQLAIIGDLLDIQKIESGKIELNKSECNSAEYMKNIVEMIRPEADEKQISFTWQQLSPLRESYLIDGVRLQQVLLNLLHNAVKFTSRGGVVKLTSEVIDQNENSNTLKFVVSDNGIGMSEDFQKEYLFKKFAQEYSSTTSPYEGCGIGLALSQEIMHQMGGEITCESEQGVGSTFTVIITAQYGGKKQKKRERIDYSQYDLSGMHILLCEDNPMNQDIERRLLEKLHAQVDLADDGQIGLEKFSQSEEGYYDVILMDIRMPNMDGWECTRCIRGLKRADAKTIAIFAVSANAFEEDVKQSLTAGMNEHFAKPINIQALYEKISEMQHQVVL